MKLKDNKIKHVVGASMAFLLGLFLFPQSVLADLTLPATPCDGEQVEAILPGFGVSAHITSNMTREDGETAFTYGADNNSFVTIFEDTITLHPDLLFPPTTSPRSYMKLLAFNASCGIVFGFSASSGTDGDVPLQAGANTVAYDTVNSQAVFNDGITFQMRPFSTPRYIWLEVWDGKTTPDKQATFSYLVDLQNPQNPTGTVGGDPPEPSGKRPVLIIPGIAGTELLDEGGDLIWPNISRMFFDVDDQFLADSLALDQNGESINNVLVGDAIDRIFIINIFNKLKESLELNGYTFDSDSYFFPYDWRNDINLTQGLLKQRIDEIKSQTGFQKIDIIAHSMGGLLAEDYLDTNGTGDINKLIFVGTPHLGAPKAGKILLHGDKLSIPWLEEDRIREIAVNSPAIYQLLASPEYFSSFSGYIAPFSFFGSSLLDYANTKQFLIDRGANSSLLDRADGFF